MIKPDDELAFDEAQLDAAAQRWTERAVLREAKADQLKAGAHTKVESKDRLAKRANRLLAHVRQAMPRLDATEAELPDELVSLVSTGVSAADMDDVMFERVIGLTRDFLGVEFLEDGQRAHRCVGRVVRPIGDGRSSYGTGFMVSPKLMMTNWHVLKTASAAAGATLELDYQRRITQSQSFLLQPDAFFLSNKELDFALVAVAPRSTQSVKLSDYGYLPLDPTQGKISHGQCVNIVQHPRGALKQVVIRGNELVDLPLESRPDGRLATEDWFAHYTADTERGSSGSPVFNDQWEVVALHHTGIPEIANGRFLDKDGNEWRRGDDPERLSWVANEGVRISSIVAAVKIAKLKPNHARARDELLRTRSSSTPTASPQSGRDADDEDIQIEPENSMSSNDVGADDSTRKTSAVVNARAGLVSVTIPLTVTVSLGRPSLGGGRNDRTGEGDGQPADDSGSPSSSDSSGAAFTESLDEDYESRPGYRADALGVDVPMPTLTKALRSQAAVVDDTQDEADFKRYELRYHHYSVIFNEKRRLAFVSAVVYDPTAKHKVVREGGDTWYYDERIPKEIQADNRFYRGKKNPLDRGHLTRRADAGWGHTKREAEQANTDSFHWTNCAPQHEIYNQSGKATAKKLQLWGNIENHIAEQAVNNERPVAIFNGPILAAKDPVVPSDRDENDKLQVPRAFWKVVVIVNDSGERSAYAFLLGQEAQISYLAEEDFDAGPFNIYQIKLKELAQRTKLDFHDLEADDALDDPTHESAFEADTEAVLVTSLEDIVM